MQLLSSLLLAAAVSGSAAISHIRTSHLAIPLAEEPRKYPDCKPVSEASCEKACGGGNTECAAFPYCWNPVAGESCCTTGGYCPRGTYCTDAGCCPDGKSLEECGANKDLTWLSNTRDTPPNASIDIQDPIGTGEPTGEKTEKPSETDAPTDTDTATDPSKPTDGTSAPTTTTTTTSSSSRPTFTPTFPTPTDDDTFTAPTPPPFETGGAAQLGGMALLGGLGAFLVAL